MLTSKHNEVEFPSGSEVREISTDSFDPFAARFFAQSLEHASRAVHAPHVEGACRERDGDSSGADTEFEYPSATCQVGQEVDRTVGVKHPAINLVVVVSQPGTV